MPIQLNRNPNESLLELGGGAHPLVHPKCMGGTDVAMDVRACYTPDGKQTVDFTADFNEPLPIKDQDFDGVICVYCLEHLSYQKLPQFVREMFRVIRPGHKALVVTANTEAQLKWIQSHPEGWDGKDAFASCSEVLFGSQDYEANTHKAYLSPAIVTKLFRDAGFDPVKITSYGERDTDMAIEAIRPISPGMSVVTNSFIAGSGATQDDTFKSLLERRDPAVTGAPVVASSPTPVATTPRAELFDKTYFCGGGKVGGYAREGYWDYPVHEITFRHVMSRRPDSVLEIGCGRGYILKRLQDEGVAVQGLEISKHCWLTRVCDPIDVHDLCATPWPANTDEHGEFQGPLDLAFSIAVFEHVPEQHLPVVLAELKRTTTRGLHGIDFGHKDDGFDKTHCSLHPKEWWRQLFDAHGLQSHEIVDKEELERGDFPVDVFQGGGKIKLNVGSFTTMFHHGWLNLDVHDLAAFAQQHRYLFERKDVRQGFQSPGQSVDLVFTSHLLQQLTYQEGVTFLRECRRLLKPGGALRVLVPDARRLVGRYVMDVNKGNPNVSGAGSLSDFGEINDECATKGPLVKKLWSLLAGGEHKSAYDAEALVAALEEAGFEARVASFRKAGWPLPAFAQLLKETLDSFPEISLICDALPKVS